MLRLLAILFCTLALQAQPSDQEIERQLAERLARSVIGKDGFTAKVKGGVVTWEGSTTVAQHKGAATRMAKSSGARRVVNNIRVAKQKQTTPAASPSKPTASPSPAAPAATTPPVPPPLKRATVQWRDARP